MKELMKIEMTSEEYEHYRNYQKELDEYHNQSKQKDDLIGRLRDQYYQEFVERQNWSKRAVSAEKKIDKLVGIVHSSMPAKLKLETLAWELENLDK